MIPLLLKNTSVGAIENHFYIFIKTIYFDTVHTILFWYVLQMAVGLTKWRKRNTFVSILAIIYFWNKLSKAIKQTVCKILSFSNKNWKVMLGDYCLKWSWEISVVIIFEACHSAIIFIIFSKSLQGFSVISYPIFF